LQRRSSSKKIDATIAWDFRWFIDTDTVVNKNPLARFDAEP
jgi:hypothetical protein